MILVAVFMTARLPLAAVGARGPGLALFQRGSALQELDRMPVGGLDERHVPVARWAQHLDPLRFDSLAELVDVVDLEREVAEEASRGVGLFLIPVVGQLDLGRVAARAAAEEDQREASRLVLLAPHLTQAQ